MSGITPLLDTLLHQVLGKRVDTAPQRELTEPVRPVDPGEGPRALHSDSRLEGRRPPIAPLPGTSTTAQRGEGQAMQGDAARAPASFQTHFSPSARTIADLLVRFPAPPSVLSTSTPLMAPGESPTATATALADRLQAGVRDSGLFYESHLSRWYRGEMSRQQLEREPQMLNTLRFTPVSATAGKAATMPANLAATNVATNVATNIDNRATASARGPVPPSLPQADVLPSSLPRSASAAQGQAAQAAGSYTVTESLYTATPRGDGAPVAGQARGSGPPGAVPGEIGEKGELGAREGSEASVRARPAGSEPVHESLQGIVRHQLEMLVAPVLRWEGDVWSGIFMALMIQLPAGAQREDQGASQDDNESQQEAWHSELQLTVPSLGEIRVALWLQEQHVRLQLLANDEAALETLQQGVPRLEQRLRDAGLATVLIDARLWNADAEENDAAQGEQG